MSAEDILKKFEMERETAKKLVDTLVRKNQAEAAEETGISDSTITRYKQKLNKMDKGERNSLIAQLALENMREK